jgi:hypothetical protein
MDTQHAIRQLILDIDGHLGGLADVHVRQVKDQLSKFSLGPIRVLSPDPEPRCGYLDEALSALAGSEALGQALALARPHLVWITYDSYPPSDIGPFFRLSHAFAPLIGKGGHIHADDWELGLFLMAPRLLYRDHHHLAPELYLPLTGPHRWRFGPHQRWQNLAANVPVWNEPWAPHATLTGEVPFLALYVWTRDVDEPAKVVHADDWKEFETPQRGSGMH